MTAMNCKRCNAGLSDEAAFCPQCGCPASKAPFFQPDKNELQQSTRSRFLVGCAAVFGTLLVMLVGLAMFTFVSVEPADEIADEIAGKELKLYGKTIDNEDFNWDAFRGKIVLVKFTATWCVFCKPEIPGMLEAYENYHDKGLEIVSVYIGEEEPKAVETVKQLVAEEKLPWTILSESLTIKADQQPQGEYFEIKSVPTMYLVGKDGKIISSRARGATLQRQLKKLFGE